MIAYISNIPLLPTDKLRPMHYIWRKSSRNISMASCEIYEGENAMFYDNHYAQGNTKSYDVEGVDGHIGTRFYAL